MPKTFEVDPLKIEKTLGMPLDILINIPLIKHVDL
jgi:hypothetical protein